MIVKRQLRSKSPSFFLPQVAEEWLQASWKSAEDQGLDQLSVEEVDAEIAAARKARRERSAAFKFL
jgi:hypothetical protein